MVSRSSRGRRKKGVWGRNVFCLLWERRKAIGGSWENFEGGGKGCVG